MTGRRASKIHDLLYWQPRSFFLNDSSSLVDINSKEIRKLWIILLCGDSLIGPYIGFLLKHNAISNVMIIGEIVFHAIRPKSVRDAIILKKSQGLPKNNQFSGFSTGRSLGISMKTYKWSGMGNSVLPFRTSCTNLSCRILCSSQSTSVPWLHM